MCGCSATLRTILVLDNIHTLTEDKEVADPCELTAEPPTINYLYDRLAREEGGYRYP